MASSFVIFGVIIAARLPPVDIPTRTYSNTLRPMGPCGTCPPGSHATVSGYSVGSFCPVGIHGIATANFPQGWLLWGHVFATVDLANQFLSTTEGAQFKDDMDAVFIIEHVAP